MPLTSVDTRTNTVDICPEACSAEPGVWFEGLHVSPSPAETFSSLAHRFSLSLTDLRGMAPRRKRPHHRERKSRRPTRSQRAGIHGSVEISSSESAEACPAAGSGSGSGRPITAYGMSSGRPSAQLAAAIEEALDHDRFHRGQSGLRCWRKLVHICDPHQRSGVDLAHGRLKSRSHGPQSLWRSALKSRLERRRVWQSLARQRL